ncbi:hypothetical protein SOVF_128810 isoform B [Spinacia oleracea]|nr:uncharacterized protein LOC110776580 isoform X2 [Spinacia oleracea]KNA12118.1 hypothetical protein SOVF_128810 isoform B [Spinacia oleracea]
MLLKYRPEDKAAKKERLLKKAQLEAEGKSPESSNKPIVVKKVKPFTRDLLNSNCMVVLIVLDSAQESIVDCKIPLLGGAMCACTWHFFYNAESLELLVALQAALTVSGNATICIAAYRIYKSQSRSENS